MDFANSKENIQPLRGGRNPTQLGVAIQAQTSADAQREILQQKQDFEDLIRSYSGSDPLANYYNYIAWIEQTFPKDGHEGNLIPLLQSCLQRFENDPRYANDWRFCKIWIKFIDYQQNPVELYKMLFAKGLCRGCTDFYKAWAFYHEISGDYKSADIVFNYGMKEMAQPHDELLLAREMLIHAAGAQLLYGADQERLQLQRNALTTLQTYKYGSYVGSARHGAAATQWPQAPAAPPAVARLAAAGNQENHGAAPFSVYAEGGADATGGDPGAAPPSVVNVARRELVHKENLMTPGVWTVAGGAGAHRPVVHKAVPFTVHEDVSDIHTRGLKLSRTFSSHSKEDNDVKFAPPIFMPEEYNPSLVCKYPKHLVYAEKGTEFSIEEIKAARYLNKERTPSPMSFASPPLLTVVSPPIVSPSKGVAIDSRPIIVPPQNHNEVEKEQVVTTNDFLLPESSRYQIDIVGLWTSRDGLSPLSGAATDRNSVAKPLGGNFEIFQDSNVPERRSQPDASAMKTLLKTVPADDLVETGSRGGLETATAAQPADGARDVIVLDNEDDEDDDDGRPGERSFASSLANSPSMVSFDFDLNAMKVSTPKQSDFKTRSPPKKSQFLTNLSPIQEDTKSQALSSSNSSKSSGSTFLNVRKLFSQETTYHMNLAQNRKVNEVLRSSLLGHLIDCVPEEHERSSSLHSSYITNAPNVAQPTTISPLISAPDDPFKTSLIDTLLERINFPGNHTYGYVRINDVPRMTVKKELTDIGGDKYVVEKLVGKGAFGSIYKAEDNRTFQTVAIKYQRKPNRWEYYICRELQARLSGSHMQERFMNIHRGYFGEQVSIFVSDYVPNGSLLDVTNALKQRTSRPMKETLCAHFCIEMLEIIDAMHRVNIIHADIKPDNFLVQLDGNTVKLQLIDFGCSIDMAMFPAGTTFLRKVTTEDFVCCEMLDGRPWSYHTDLFCVAATAHVLLFDKYIKMQKKDERWSITQRLVRYYRVDCWNLFFTSLLNQQTGPARVDQLIPVLNGILDTNRNEYNAELRFLVNMLRKR